MKRLILLAACLAFALSAWAETTHYLYVTGGRAPSVSEPNLDPVLDATIGDIEIRGVLVADVDADNKTVTNWRRAGILPTAHPDTSNPVEWGYLHDAVNYYNGRIYVGPGTQSGASETANFIAIAEVLYGGQLTAFTTSSRFPNTGSTNQRLAATTIMEISGQAYIYVMGGNHDETGQSDRILYAPIDSGSGNIGAWQISTTPLAAVDWFNSAISDSGNLIHSSGNLRGSQSIDVVTPSLTGDITTAWSSSTYSADFTNRWDHLMLKATSGGNTFAFLVGGTGNTSGGAGLDRVDFAALTAGVPGTWGLTDAMPDGRRRLAGAAINDMIIVPGGSTTTSFADGTNTVFIGDVDDAGAISWTTAAEPMLQSRAYHGATIAEIPPAPLSAFDTWAIYE